MEGSFKVDVSEIEDTRIEGLPMSVYVKSERLLS